MTFLACIGAVLISFAWILPSLLARIVSADTSVCTDDNQWVDSKFGGTGTSKCNSGTNGGVAANPTWCLDYGEYSAEARRACPVACGLCPQVCADDDDWLDSKYGGSGTSKCNGGARG